MPFWCAVCQTRSRVRQTAASSFAAPSYTSGRLAGTLYDAAKSNVQEHILDLQEKSILCMSFFCLGNKTLHRRFG